MKKLKIRGSILDFCQNYNTNKKKLIKTASNRRSIYSFFESFAGNMKLWLRVYCIRAFLKKNNNNKKKEKKKKKSNTKLVVD